jgi:hypothetical protein
MLNLCQQYGGQRTFEIDTEDILRLCGDFPKSCDDCQGHPHSVKHQVYGKFKNMREQGTRQFQPLFSEVNLGFLLSK